VGLAKDDPAQPVVTDKAARYTNCVENAPDNTLRITEELTPEYGGGVKVSELPGQIPQWPVRVVFQDDNYDGAKDDLYQSDVVTWHWDDIQVQAASAEEVAVVPPISRDPSADDESQSAPPDAVASAPGDADGGDGIGEFLAVVILGAVLLFVGGLALGALLGRDRAARGPTRPQD
jgi:hypothetical protein